MINFIKNIIQTIKELKQLDEAECYPDKTCQLTQEELERIGSESFDNAK